MREGRWLLIGLICVGIAGLIIYVICHHFLMKKQSQTTGAARDLSDTIIALHPGPVAKDIVRAIQKVQENSAK